MCVSTRVWLWPDRDEKLITYCASKEIPHLLWNQVHYRVHNRPPLAHIQSQIYLVHTYILFRWDTFFVLSSRLRLGLSIKRPLFFSSFRPTFYVHFIPRRVNAVNN
jgi:Glutamine amidotransferase